MRRACIAAAAVTIGADKTGIGVETFDPPFGRAYVDLMSRAMGGDAAAKHEARVKIAAMCPNP